MNPSHNYSFSQIADQALKRLVYNGTDSGLEASQIEELQAQSSPFNTVVKYLDNAASQGYGEWVDDNGRRSFRPYSQAEFQTKSIASEDANPAELYLDPQREIPQGLDGKLGDIWPAYVVEGHTPASVVATFLRYDGNPQLEWGPIDPRVAQYLDNLQGTEVEVGDTGIELLNDYTEEDIIDAALPTVDVHSLTKYYPGKRFRPTDLEDLLSAHPSGTSREEFDLSGLSHRLAGMIRILEMTGQITYENNGWNPTRHARNILNNHHRISYEDVLPENAQKRYEILTQLERENRLPLEEAVSLEYELGTQNSYALMALDKAAQGAQIAAQNLALQRRQMFDNAANLAGNILSFIPKLPLATYNNLTQLIPDSREAIIGEKIGAFLGLTTYLGAGAGLMANSASWQQWVAYLSGGFAGLGISALTGKFVGNIAGKKAQAPIKREPLYGNGIQTVRPSLPNTPQRLPPARLPSGKSTSTAEAGVPPKTRSQNSRVQPPEVNRPGRNGKRPVEVITGSHTLPTRE